MPERGSWRDYQNQLNKTFARKKIISKMVKYGCFLFIISIMFFFFYGNPAQTENHRSPLPDGDYTRSEVIENDPITFSPDNAFSNELRKQDLRSLMSRGNFVNLRDQSFQSAFHNRHVKVVTSLDIPLQNFLIDHIDRKTAIYVGIVIMDPVTGRIRVMASYNKTDPTKNLCIDNCFPAASVFKVVTVAAGIEVYDYHQESSFAFNGRKHTLYRSQLKEYTNRYTQLITLEDSFAQSINPVFGKIGAHLGKGILKKYAEAFGFNHAINFEIPVKRSIVSFSDDLYALAEIASGFNRDTTLSPLHGALIASTILNQGKWIAPTIINRIIDDTEKTIYTGQGTPIHQAIAPKTAMIISNLMAATVQSGTCRKAFRGYKNNPILSQLNIGGKSGSINSRAQDKRFDWFVGFAQDKHGPEQLAMSIVVAHGKYIGTKASVYAKMAIEHYFRNYFAKSNANMHKIES